jgi:hypothetical protein
LDVSPTDEGGREGEERLVDARPPLVADGEAAEAADPGQRPFNDPAVPAQAFAARHPTSGDPSLDPATTQGLAAAWQAVGLVGVELGWTPPRTPSPPANGRPGVDQVLEDAAVGEVGGRAPDG